MLNNIILFITYKIIFLLIYKILIIIKYTLRTGFWIPVKNSTRFNL